MTVLPLVLEPDARLHIPSTPVEAVTDDIRTLLDNMLETMYAHQGIGLAAVQVGIHKNIIVVDVAQREGRNEPIKLINPEIVQESPQQSVYQEGCLSFPDQFSDVERPARVTVQYLDENGAPQEIKAEGIMATCLQHEIDHTKGIVFTDHISKLKRDMILRKLTKAKRLGLLSEYPEETHA
jgi:peptide deformylase